MEAVYFAFGLLVLALVLTVILKRFAPKDARVSELGEAITPDVEIVPPVQDDFKHITAMRESVAAREKQERLVGSVLLSSGVNTDATIHIREMVTRLQSLSGTPNTPDTSLESL